MGRIAAVKMTVLPRVLYYFRSLPIPVPSTFFRKLLSLIYKFIWDNGDCRVAQATLYTSRWQGGPGVPHFLCYYRAAQLVQLYQVFSKTYQPDWVWLEVQASTSLPIDLLIWLFPKECRAITSPSLSHSLDLWDTVCKLYPMKSPHSPVAPLFNNIQIPP